MTSLEINKIHLGNCFDLLPLVQDHSIDAIITDPPYGVLKGHRIETNVDIPRFFAECKRVMKPNAFIAFFGMMPTAVKWCSEAMEVFDFKNEIIWCKRNTGFAGDWNFNKIHENIFVYRQGKIAYFKTKMKWSDIIRDECEAGIVSPEAILRELTYWKSKASGNILKDTGFTTQTSKNDYYKHDSLPVRKMDNIFGKDTKNISSIWSFAPHNCQNRNGTGVDHPTVKPIELLKRLVELLTPEPTDDCKPLILDPFMGSGTTALACQSLNRNFIGMELYPDYVEIANRRLLQARNLFTDTKFTQPQNDATMNELDTKQGEMF